MIQHSKRLWRLPVAVAAIFVPALALGSLTLPYTFTSGTAIRAAEVNADFEALRAKADALETLVAQQRPKLYATSSVISGSVDFASVATIYWFGGTPAAMVPANARVVTSIWAGFGWPINPSISTGFGPCYRRAGGAPVWFTTDMINVNSHAATAGQVQVPAQGTLTVPSAGSYEFGICGSADIGSSNLMSFKVLSATATVWE